VLPDVVEAAELARLSKGVSANAAAAQRSSSKPAIIKP
jgi:hypothetical protein